MGVTRYVTGACTGATEPSAKEWLAIIDGLGDSNRLDYGHMDWPNFEHDPLIPDAVLRRKRTGAKVPVYTMATWCREHGKSIFKDVVQSHPDDLEEGPNNNVGNSD